MGSETTLKQRWMLPVVGVLFIIVGIIMLAAPGATMATFAILFPVSFFVWGIFEICFAFANIKYRNWGWYLVNGILDVLIGILLINSSVLAEIQMIAFFMGFWLMFRGVMAMGHAFDLKRLGAKNWGWLLATAILSIVLSFVVLMLPLAAVETLLIWVSVTLICVGVSSIAQGVSGQD